MTSKASQLSAFIAVANTVAMASLPAGATFASSSDITSAVDTAYANAVSGVSANAATAYSNAVATSATDASTKAATAYSNATSYADMVAATAYSNAVSHAVSNTYVNSTFAPIINPTFTANATVSGGLVANTIAVSNYIDFANNATAPTQKEGRVFYDQSSKTLAYYVAEPDVTLNIGQESWIRVYNASGADVPNGAPVRFAGALNGVPTIQLASASTLAGVTWIGGVVTHSIENNSYGYVSNFGRVNDVDLSAFDVGDPVYVSTTPGGLTKVAPTAPNYPALVGGVVANGTSGTILVKIEPYEYATLRVTGDARFDGTLTVAGNLNILGNTTSTSVSSIEVSNTMIYLNGGNQTSNNAFVGAGLNDATLTGHLQYSNTTTFYIKIDSVGATDTFAWSTDDFATTRASNVAITGGSQWVGGGLLVAFGSTTGHTLNDKWSATLTPVNVDAGVVSNYHTGEDGVYTHTGYFRDASDGRFKFFAGYTPEPNTSINIAHASFAFADIQANVFYGTLNGNVVGNADTATAANNALYLGGQAASYYANAAAPGTAYSNAVSTASTDASSKAATAYSNAVSTASTDASSKAATAYSNAVAYAAANTYVNTQLALKANLTGAAFTGAVSGITTLAAGNTSITGTITATGDITAFYSDARLKDFRGTIPDALAKVHALNGYYYVGNAKAGELGYDTTIMQVGVSAQEAKAVMPEIVAPAPISAEYLTVKYEKFAPLLIEAIKEVDNKYQQQITDLREEIARLKG